MTQTMPKALNLSPKGSKMTPKWRPGPLHKRLGNASGTKWAHMRSDPLFTMYKPHRRPLEVPLFRPLGHQLSRFFQVSLLDTLFSAEKCLQRRPKEKKVPKRLPKGSLWDAGGGQNSTFFRPRFCPGANMAPRLDFEGAKGTPGPPKITKIEPTKGGHFVLFFQHVW